VRQMPDTETLESLKKLIGKTVTAVEHYGSTMNEGFIISFSDGNFLTAQDGEYGDNAFEFLTREEVEEIRKRK